MESNLFNNALKKAGNSHKYQYILLLLSTLTWVFIDLISISFPFIQKMPKVQYYNSTTHTNIITTLTYEICEDKDITYNKTKVYDYSWISELDVECNRFKNSIISMGIFSADIIGK